MKERLTDTKRCNEWITIKPDGCSCHQCKRLEECDNNMKLYIMKHFVPRVALDRLEPKRLDKNKIIKIIEKSWWGWYYNKRKGDKVGLSEYMAEALVNKEADLYE